MNKINQHNNSLQKGIIKTTLSSLFFLFFLNVHSQNTLKLKKIDSIVSTINASALPPQRDTIIKDHPDLGLKMTTYLTMIIDGNQLIKYVNYVETKMTENGIAKEITGSNTFYYHHNNLIKVEEYLTEAGKKKNAEWYYSDDKPLYYSLQSDKKENRAELLLALAQTMLNQIIK